PVDREAVLVGTNRLVARRADHALGGDAVSGDRLLVAAVLGPERAARLLGGREWIEAGVGPVLENRLEDARDQLGLEVLRVVTARPAVDLVEPAGVPIDVAVVVHGAEDGIEVDDAVEEAPGHVSLHRA